MKYKICLLCCVFTLKHTTSLDFHSRDVVLLALKDGFRFHIAFGKHTLGSYLLNTTFTGILVRAEKYFHGKSAIYLFHAQLVETCDVRFCQMNDTNYQRNGVYTLRLKVNQKWNALLVCQLISRFGALVGILCLNWINNFNNWNILSSNNDSLSAQRLITSVLATDWVLKNHFYISLKSIISNHY